MKLLTLIVALLAMCLLNQQSRADDTDALRLRVAVELQLLQMRQGQADSGTGTGSAAPFQAAQKVLADATEGVHGSGNGILAKFRERRAARGGILSGLFSRRSSGASFFSRTTTRTRSSGTSRGSGGW